MATRTTTAAKTKTRPKAPRQSRVVLDDKLLLSVQQAALLLGVSERMAWKLVAREELPSLKVGRLRRVSRQALNEFCAAGLSA